MKNKFIFCLLLLLGLSAQSFAQTHNWVGTAGDGLWSSPTNWSPAAIPGPGNHVGIDGNVIVHVDIDVSVASILSLGLTGGATSQLIIDAGSTLTITNRGIRFFNATASVIVNGHLNISHLDSGFSGITNQTGGTVTINSTGEITIDDAAVSSYGIVSTGTIVNDGSISVSNIASNEGIFITGGSLTNNGTITIADNIASNLALRGNIINTATGTIKGTSANTTATIFNDVSLNGCTISPGNSTGQLTFRSGFAPLAGTSYYAEIEKTGAITESDLIYFTNAGAASFNVSNLNVAVTDIGSTAFVVNDQFTILTAPNGFTGTFASIALPTSYTWNVAYTLNNVVLTVTAVLPVHLSSFTAKQENQTVALNWSTASESNNKGFFVLKSKDGKKWEDIGFVQGNNTTNKPMNYSFTDTNPSAGFNFYKLKQVDFDGTSEYSTIKNVNFSGEDRQYQAFPNPSKGVFTIDGLDEKNETIISIYSIQGQQLMTITPNDKLIDASTLSPGTYILQVGGEHQKIVIQ